VRPSGFGAIPKVAVEHAMKSKDEVNADLLVIAAGM